MDNAEKNLRDTRNDSGDVKSIYVSIETRRHGIGIVSATQSSHV